MAEEDDEMAGMTEEGGDDDMAAAMEGAADDMAAAMEGGDAPADAGGDDMAAAMAEDGSTLSQDEIDSLLGFSSDAGQATSGVQALLDRSRENYERLPMLEVVFDRFVRSASTSLRNFTGENVEVNIESITSMRFEDYLNSVPLPALLAIFQAVEWENFGIITIDSSMTYSMVDVLLGGGRMNRPIRIEGRPFTVIEQDMIKNLCKIMLEDMASAFNPLTPITFRMERLETNPRFATITRPANPAILISLRVDMEERGGKAEVLFPYATIEPVKELLLQMFSGESFGADMTWENYLNEGVLNTPVEIEATLLPKTILLRELASMKVGDTIVMNNTPKDDIDLICKGVKMMSGRVGSSGKNLAMQISDIYTKNMDELL